MIDSGLAVEVQSVLEDTPWMLEYVAVFILAMVPAIEPFIVIPVAIGLGLDPLVTAIAAFAGSIAAMGMIILAHQWLAAWWSHRVSGDEGSQSGRYRRVRVVWERYGIIGLAFAGPLLAGIHLTAVFAAFSTRDMRITGIWLAVGLGFWTVFLTVGSIVGLSLIGLR